MFNSTKKTVFVQCYKLEYKFILEGWHYTAFFTISVLYILLAIPTVIVNLATLSVFSSKRYRKLPSTIFIINNTVADLLTGILAMPLGGSNLFVIVLEKKVICVFYAATIFVGFVFCVFSFLTVFYITVDRFYAIFYPFKYSSKDWNSLFLWINLFSWIMTVCLVASSFLFKGFRPTILFLSVQPIIVTINAILLLLVWRTIKRIRKSDLGKPHQGIETQDDTTNVSPERTAVKRERLKAQQEDRRATVMTILMLVSVVVCYLPYFTIAMWWAVDENSPKMTYTLGGIAQFLAPVKALVNPLLYVYTMKSVRLKIKKAILRSRIGTLEDGNTINFTRPNSNL
ncbi:D(4) dopamine receptor-like [Clytia hemisphaerica]|uniref:D(4) dopamine receptor-like n=1 Tax=Clytia hemisphaerica TaxID=252671 RepID=UPI0034D414FA